MRVKEETVAASTSNLMKYDCEVLFATVNLPFRKSCFAPSSKETSSQTIVTKKKAAHFFVIQNGDPSSNSHDSHHLLQEKRSQDDLGCSMNVLWLSQLPRLRDDPTGSPGSPRRRELGC